MVIERVSLANGIGSRSSRIAGAAVAGIADELAPAIAPPTRARPAITLRLPGKYRG
jgi:hypothetical protein